MTPSLRQQLMGWVLGPLILLAALNAGVNWFSARDAANLVTDQTLLASARSIAEQAQVEDGLIQATVPPAALEMFDTGAGDFVYYAVTDENGRLIAGVSGLPAPARSPEARGVIEADYRGRRLRLLALDHPLTGPGLKSSVTVTVGVSLGNRDALVRHFWLAGAGQQLLLIGAAGLFMLFGLKRGLAPLLRLRDVLRARPSTSLEPLDPAVVQNELQPLVTAVNQQMSRVQKQYAAQQRFVANAAHQLRTPLTLLNVQAIYALRRQASPDDRDVLEAIRASTQRLSRLAGQLLTLSRAEPGSRRPRADLVDLAVLAERVLEGFAEPALSKGIDLGLEVKQPATVTGDGTMIAEALTNVVDNAIRYCARGDSVTVAVSLDADTACLCVQDTGPGAPAEELERLFERFYRVPGASGDGSGLGLAIVKEVAEAAGGSASATRGPQAGLSIHMRFPTSAEINDVANSLARPKAD